MRREASLTLRDLLGFLKDKASFSRAAFLSKPNTRSLRLAILGATTHNPSTPPNEKHIPFLLSLGDGSRSIAFSFIKALMNRLHKTRSSSVALKCLITIHMIIRRGSFILQDQLSTYQAAGGRNYLNLSNFRDNSNPETWYLSAWVRWYAMFVESLLITSRVLAFFFCHRKDVKECFSGLQNPDLLKEIDVLVSLIEEICSAPEFLYKNVMVHQAMGLVNQDCNSAQTELLSRITEIGVRRDELSSADSVELVCVLKRLESCEERIVSLFLDKKGSIGDRLRGLVKEMIGEGNEYGEGRRLLTMGGRRVDVSESARFGDGVVSKGGSFRFSSGRQNLDRVPIWIPEYVR